MKKKSTANKHNKTNKQPEPKNFNAISVFGVIILIVLFIYLYKSLMFVQDDAYITFRYVKNFIAGNGLVFNIGEYVEGYSNFLWLLLLSLTSVLGFGIEKTSTNLSIFFGLTTIILIYKLTEFVLKTNEDRNSTNYKNVFTLIPALLLVLTGSFGYWAVSGMETSLFVSLILFSIFIYFKQPGGKLKYSLPVLMFLIYLLRPEGLVVFFLIYSYKLFYILLRKRKDYKPEFMKLLIELIIFLIPLLLYTTFRLFYFGYPFPNTYYAKSGFSIIYLQAGLDYFWGFCKAYLIYGLLLIIPFYLFFGKRITSEISFLFYFIISYILVVILLGGDVLAFYRFLLPVAPVIYLLITLSVFYFSDDLVEKNPWINKKVLNVILIVVLLLPGVFNYINEKEKITASWINETELVNKMKFNANLVSKRQIESGRQIKVAATTIGALSYFTEANVIDMLGLTDKFIAHNPKIIEAISGSKGIGWKERKYNADYILERKPDHIIFSTGAKPSAFAERALFAAPEFFSNYYPEQILVPSLGSSVIIYSTKEKFKKEFKSNLTDTSKIDYKFIEHYIAASGYLTKFETDKDLITGNSLLEECNKANKLCPAYFSDGYRILGRYYYLINDNENAKLNFLKAVEIDDMNSLAQAGLAVVYAKSKNMPQAQYHYAKTLKLSPDMIAPQ